VNALGNATFKGIFTDSSAVAGTSSISADGYWPLYVPLKGGTEALWGWSQISSGEVNTLPASSGGLQICH
jgi:hypothetical protein